MRYPSIPSSNVKSCCKLPVGPGRRCHLLIKRHTCSVFDISWRQPHAVPPLDDEALELPSILWHAPAIGPRTEQDDSHSPPWRLGQLHHCSSSAKILGASSLPWHACVLLSSKPALCPVPWSQLKPRSIAKDHRSCKWISDDLFPAWADGVYQQPRSSQYKSLPGSPPLKHGGAQIQQQRVQHNGKWEVWESPGRGPYKMPCTPRVWQNSPPSRQPEWGGTLPKTWAIRKHTSPVGPGKRTLHGWHSNRNRVQSTTPYTMRRRHEEQVPLAKGAESNNIRGQVSSQSCKARALKVAMLKRVFATTPLTMIGFPIPMTVGILSEEPTWQAQAKQRLLVRHKAHQSSSGCDCVDTRKSSKVHMVWHLGRNISIPSPLDTYALLSRTNLPNDPSGRTDNPINCKRSRRTIVGDDGGQDRSPTVAENSSEVQKSRAHCALASETVRTRATNSGSAKASTRPSKTIGFTPVVCHGPKLGCRHCAQCTDFAVVAGPTSL